MQMLVQSLAHVKITQDQFGNKANASPGVYASSSEGTF